MFFFGIPCFILFLFYTKTTSGSKSTHPVTFHASVSTNCKSALKSGCDYYLLGGWTVSVGIKPKGQKNFMPIQLQIDSGSPNTWLFINDTKFSLIGDNGHVIRKLKYSDIVEVSSPSYHITPGINLMEKKEITFSDKSKVLMSFYKNRVMLLDQNRGTTVNFEIGLAETFDTTFVPHKKNNYNGLLGLRLGLPRRKHQENIIMGVFLKQKKLKPIVSIDLNWLDGTSKPSFMEFGYPLQAPKSYIDVTSNARDWSFTAANVTFEFKDPSTRTIYRFRIPKPPVIVDTGTDVMLIPEKYIKQMNTQNLAKFTKNIGKDGRIVRNKCDKPFLDAIPTIKIDLKGDKGKQYTVTIPPNKLYIKIMSHCHELLASSKNHLVLGTPFFTSVYTEFNFKTGRIKIAQK